MIRTALFILLVNGCNQKTELSSSPSSSRGKTLFLANCIACHNSNPKLDGPVGPSIYGSSAELIRKKVIEGNYPSGYKPKRATQIMPALKHLEPEVEALVEFLNK